MARLFQDLADAFPPTSRASWRAQVEATLDGRRFEDVFVRRTAEGLAVQPLYDRSDLPDGTGTEQPGGGSFVRGWPRPGSEGAARRGWARGTSLAHPDAAVANTRLLADLMGGAERARLHLASAAHVRAAADARTRAASERGGIWVAGISDLERLLHDVMWPLAPVALLAPVDPSLDAWLSTATRGLRTSRNSSHAHGLGFQVDVVGRALASPRPAWPLDPALLHDDVSRAGAGEVSPLDARPLLISTTRLRLAGADAVQEVAAALSAFVAVARALEPRGMAPADVLRATEFELAAGSDFFTEIAKLRAFRLALALVLDTIGISRHAGNVLVSAVTAEETLSRRDVYVNLLRTTAQAAAAVFGGADTVMVARLDERHGGSLVGHRLARNLQALLAEESDAGVVTDPGGGSFYIEARTAQLGEAAWAQFTAWEGAGGFLVIAGDGTLTAALDARWQQRRGALRTRREPVLGTSIFPDPADTPPPRDAFDVDAFLARWAERTDVVDSTPSVGPDLPVHHLGEDFDRLYDRAVALGARTGTPPVVTAIAVGPLATYTARLDWVRDLLLSGGIALTEHTVDAPPPATWYTPHATAIVVLVAADGEYETLVPVAAPALTAAGTARVFVAGRPGAHEPAWRAAGVSGFIHVGIDVWQFLTGVLDTLESRHATA